MSEPEPCPCEDKTPPASPGPVADQEILVRFVENRTHVATDGSGMVYLVPTAIRKEDLRGKNGRSFSLAREAHSEGSELIRRAAARTAEVEWKRNPVFARTRTERLRAIVDKAKRREVCVNSDPTTSENDPLGAF